MRGSLAVAGRVLAGLRGDHVTLGFVVGAPVLIFFLFGEVLDVVPEGRIDTAFMQPVLLGVFLFMLTYVLTGIGFLRERQQGTLERMLATPLPNVSIVLGYLIGFGVLALIQASVMLGSGILFLDVSFDGSVLAFYGVEALAALSALGIGILVSLVARTEFQILQTIPVIISPQIILGGVFVDVDRLPVVFEYIARALPLTYILSAMDHIILGNGEQEDLVLAVVVLSITILLSVAAASFLVRRRS